MQSGTLVNGAAHPLQSFLHACIWGRPPSSILQVTPFGLTRYPRRSGAAPSQVFRRDMRYLPKRPSTLPRGFCDPGATHLSIVMETCNARGEDPGGWRIGSADAPEGFEGGSRRTDHPPPRGRWRAPAGLPAPHTKALLHRGLGLDDVLLERRGGAEKLVLLHRADLEVVE